MSGSKRWARRERTAAEVELISQGREANRGELGSEERNDQGNSSHDPANVSVRFERGIGLEHIDVVEMIGQLELA